MKIIILALMLFLTACGYSELGTNGVVQVKRVHVVNPLICPKYYVLDASLGIMQNGVGSMSTQDIDLTVSEKQATELDELLKKGKSIVNIKYNTRRFSLCEEMRLLESYEVSDLSGHSTGKDSSQTEPTTPKVEVQDSVYTKCTNLAKSVQELAKCKELFGK